VGLLGQKALVFQFHADIPGTESLLKHDGVQQAPAPDHAFASAANAFDLFSELFAQREGALVQVFPFQHFQRGHADGAGQGVAPEGGAMAARGENLHDLRIGDNGRDGENTSAQGFSEAHYIGSGIFVVPGEAFSGPAKACLYFVEYQKNAPGLADFSQFGQIALPGHDDTGFALDGLDQDSDGIVVDSLFHRRRRRRAVSQSRGVGP
jgi:hypothetical protein